MIELERLESLSGRLVATMVANIDSALEAEIERPDGSLGMARYLLGQKRGVEYFAHNLKMQLTNGESS